jgi:alpha-glucosidase
VSWRDGVVYQIYPRSFCDSNGDGVGDLAGIRSKLDHLQDLGVDAIWLSPIYPSPMADFGYDVSDYERVDPVFGTLDDFHALSADLRARDIKLLLDFVPCHTSIEHRWFAERPDWYIWADGRGGGPPNNWVAAFGGSAWTYHEGRGRWYLHSFYPEQPDLDWRRPEVAEAMTDVLRLWTERGADGFRIDAIDRLMKDPHLRDEPPRAEPFPFPLNPDEERLALVHSRNGPGTGEALAKIRAAVGEDAFLVGEIYLPASQVGPYLDHFDRFFVFELLFAEWEPSALRRAIGSALGAARQEGTAPAWVMSNHDFGWLASRVGERNVEDALTLLLTLPGTVFLYQGDEAGRQNGPDTGGDRYGRDRYRTPLDWNVVENSALLARTKELIAQRRELDGALAFVDDPDPRVLAYRRGERLFRIVCRK